MGHRTGRMKPTRVRSGRSPNLRTCKICGCTEDRACVVDVNGRPIPCSWIAEDLDVCSACGLQVVQAMANDPIWLTVVQGFALAGSVGVRVGFTYRRIREEKTAGARRGTLLRRARHAR